MGERKRENQNVPMQTRVKSLYWESLGVERSETSREERREMELFLCSEVKLLSKEKRSELKEMVMSGRWSDC